MGLTEIRFADVQAFDDYVAQHTMRDSTKVQIGKRKMSFAKAREFADKNRGKVVNPYIKKFGKYKLNALPPADVKEEDIEVNLEGNINSHAVLKWKDPKSGRTVNAYTQKFLQKNAKIKWSRIKKLSDDQIVKIDARAQKLFKNRKKSVADSAAIISIISKTGLRPGSQSGFDDTGNRGVSTLSPDNVTVNGDKITINFVGKSYQPNNAVFRDKALANYLKKRLNERKGEDFLFDATSGQVNGLFKKVGYKGMQIKDMRTYAATKMAADILKKDKTPPPPLPKTQTEIKKAVKEKLNKVFEQVSQRLNNTPAMAKSSYIHPEVIDKWLEELGVKAIIKK